MLDAPRGRARPRARASRPSRSGRRSSAASYDLLYVGGGQDREQAMIAPDLAAPGRDDPRGRRGRCRAPRSLRRLPAPRARVPRPRRLLARRRRALPARDGRGRDAHDRRRAARERSAGGARQDDRGVREPRGPNTARRGRVAARQGRLRLRERRRLRLRGVSRRPGRRDLSPRPAACRATRGSPTCFSPGRWRMRPERSPSLSRRSTTSWSARLTRSQPAGRAPGAAVQPD